MKSQVGSLFNTKAILITGLLFGLSAQASVFPDKVISEKIEGAKRHNIVFILTDDHRYDAMGFMGHPFMILHT
jgi:N-acetylglucosamine-6-sulfatase